MVYLISTVLCASLSSRGLGHQVFILVTGVRIPVGMPFFVLNPCSPDTGSPCQPTWYKSPWECHLSEISPLRRFVTEVHNDFSLDFSKNLVILYRITPLRAGVAKWQTHQTLNLALVTACGFDPHLRHHFFCLFDGLCQKFILFLIPGFRFLPSFYTNGEKRSGHIRRLFTASASCRGRPIRNSRHINKAHTLQPFFFFIFLNHALDFLFSRCMVSPQEAGHIPSEQRLHQSHQTLQYVVIKLERLCTPASVLF